MLVERSLKNPILKPRINHSWEAEAVLNGCPVKKGKEIYLLYRAISLPHYHTFAKTKLVISDIGVARSKDGIEFNDRHRLVIPEHPWEKFGCEDPRVTKLNNKYYIFYTALSAYPFRAEGIKIGVAVSKDLKKVETKHLVTPFNAKAMALFPEKIEGKMWAVLTVHSDQPPAKICLASFAKEEELWSEKKWREWYQNYEKYALPLQRRPEDHIEVGAPPLKTKQGWLLFYSYIRNYFSPQRTFSVEAVLFDLKNPQKIIAKTRYPLMSPEEYYEKFGIVKNVIFPSGALLENNTIKLYYGAADTTCCLAYLNLRDLLAKLSRDQEAIKFTRAKENPLITPVAKHPWEAKATFNPAAIYLDGKIRIIYRAQSLNNTSVLGYAESRDGFKIDYRSPEPIYAPREPFEQKLVPEGNSGCEDPRLTQINNKIYMCYTAFDGRNPWRIALTWILEKDFLAKKWNWSKPVLISPPDMDDKDACIFPIKIREKYFILHRSGDDIDSAFVPSLDFDGQTWLEEYRWIAPRPGMWDSRKVGIAAPPLKTKDGWILFYHGISEDDKFYRVGALLLDPQDPLQVLARSDEPLLEPEAAYEKNGLVANVVFPCGAVKMGEKILIYYGGGDQVVGAASISIEKLLCHLKAHKC